MKKYDDKDLVSRKIFLPEWLWQKLMKEAEKKGVSLSIAMETALNK